MQQKNFIAYYQLEKIHFLPSLLFQVQYKTNVHIETTL